MVETSPCQVVGEIAGVGRDRHLAVEEPRLLEDGHRRVIGEDRLRSRHVGPERTGRRRHGWTIEPSDPRRQRQPTSRPGPRVGGNVHRLQAVLTAQVFGRVRTEAEVVHLRGVLPQCLHAGSEAPVCEQRELENGVGLQVCAPGHRGGDVRDGTTIKQGPSVSRPCRDPASAGDHSAHFRIKPVVAPPSTPDENRAGNSMAAVSRAGSSNNAGPCDSTLRGASCPSARSREAADEHQQDHMTACHVAQGEPGAPENL